MITTHVTADQLEQLEALLADTTPGGDVYRPPVGRDVNLLGALADVGLVIYTADCGYEITDAGRAIVIDRAIDAANTHVFVLYATDEELHAAIAGLKAEADTADDVVRDRALTDIEACQDELDRRDGDSPPSESTGRHRAIPADDRPTETIARVELMPVADETPVAVLPTQELTAPMPSVGTLPDVPVKGLTDVLSPDYGEKLYAAIKGADTGEDVYDELVAEATGEWEALEADLADDRSWLRRNLTPPRVLALSVLAAVVVTWFAAWLVMGR